MGRTAHSHNANKYIPDFPAMMRLYEVNYAQLCRLLPREKQPGCALVYQIGLNQYQLSIEERTRYTTLIKIQQSAPKVTYWSLPELVVRLYHDALIAEVCSSRQIYRFKASYDYPNQKLLQRDEKHQINQLLADWLNYCLKHAMIMVPVD